MENYQTCLCQSARVEAIVIFHLEKKEETKRIAHVNTLKHYNAAKKQMNISTNEEEARIKSTKVEKPVLHTLTNPLQNI